MATSPSFPLLTRLVTKFFVYQIPYVISTEQIEQAAEHVLDFEFGLGPGIRISLYRSNASRNSNRKIIALYLILRLPVVTLAVFMLTAYSKISLIIHARQATRCGIRCYLGRRNFFSDKTLGVSSHDCRSFLAGIGHIFKILLVVECILFIYSPALLLYDFCQSCMCALKLCTMLNVSTSSCMTMLSYQNCCFVTSQIHD